MLLRKTISPMFLWDFVAGIVLTIAARHGFEFAQAGAFFSMGGILRTVFEDQLFHKVGPFEHDTASRGLGGDFAEVGEIFAVFEDIQQIALVVDVLARELNNRA